MYIEKIKIDKFRVLKDIEIHFQLPGGATADPETGNVVNVVAGVNGCGKSTLLDLIDKIRNDADEKSRKINPFFPKNKSFISDDENGLCMEFEEGKLYIGDGQLNKVKDDLWEVGDVSLNDVVYFDFKYFSRNKVNESPDRKKSEIYEETAQTINNYVINLERQSSKSSSEDRKIDAIKEFNKIFENVDFYTRLSGVQYEDGIFKPEFLNANGQKVFIYDLSDGEQRLYLSAMRMMNFDYQNKVILMDEPEVSLHPAWQQKIMQIYSRIGKNNQFIVATHSPQIIANTPYQNLIILKKDNDKITPYYPSRPPIGTDVNSILSDFMGINGDYPEDVMNLHREYRQFVKDGKEDLQEAMTIKNKLLKKESNDSRFMQEMRILQRLRGMR